MTTVLSVPILFSSALLISLTSAVLPLTLAETCTVSPLPLTGTVMAGALLLPPLLPLLLPPPDGAGVSLGMARVSV